MEADMETWVATRVTDQETRAGAPAVAGVAVTETRVGAEAAARDMVPRIMEVVVMTTTGEWAIWATGDGKEARVDGNKVVKVAPEEVTMEGVEWIRATGVHREVVMAGAVWSRATGDHREAATDGAMKTGILAEGQEAAVGRLRAGVQCPVQAWEIQAGLQVMEEECQDLAVV